MLPTTRNGSIPASTWNGPTNRLETLFDRFFGEEFASPATWTSAPVSMWQDEDHFYIEAEVPGVAQDQVDLTIHDGVLYIRYERKAEPGRKYLYNGRAFGKVERRINLPDEVDAENVQANLVHGVLHVSLPRRPEAKPRKIEVKAVQG